MEGFRAEGFIGFMVSDSSCGLSLVSFLHMHLVHQWQSPFLGVWGEGHTRPFINVSRKPQELKEQSSSYESSYVGMWGLL